jgi:hypothetical protein
MTLALLEIVSVLNQLVICGMIGCNALSDSEGDEEQEGGDDVGPRISRS